MDSSIESYSTHTADINGDEQKKAKPKKARHNSLIMDLQHQQTSNKSREAQCAELA